MKLGFNIDQFRHVSTFVGWFRVYLYTSSGVLRPKVTTLWSISGYIGGVCDQNKFLIPSKMIGLLNTVIEHCYGYISFLAIESFEENSGWWCSQSCKVELAAPPLLLPPATHPPTASATFSSSASTLASNLSVAPRGGRDICHPPGHLRAC